MKTFSKTLFLVLLSLSLVTFNSCEKDEGEQAKSDLIGTWTIQSSDFEATIDGTDMVTFIATSYGIPEAQAQLLVDLMTADFGSDMSGTITFNEDNTYSATMDGDTESGTWSLSSDGKKLTITGTDDMGTYTDVMDVVSLSSSQLILQLASESEGIDLDDDGTNDATMEIAIELILVK